MAVAVIAMSGMSAAGAEVDLGLSVLWASANMDTADNGFGQVSAEELCGGYYGWADPTGLLTAADDSLYPSGDIPTEISGTQYDIARAKWGGEWRLPTHEEFVELYNNCNTTTETLNGVAGMRFTSIKNGNNLLYPHRHRGSTAHARHIHQARDPQQRQCTSIQNTNPLTVPPKARAHCAA